MANPTRQLFTAASLSLPKTQRLRGEENYGTWRSDMLMALGQLNLELHVDPEYVALYKPQDIDWKHGPSQRASASAKKASEGAQRRFEEWKVKDLQARCVLTSNIDSITATLAVKGETTAIRVWNELAKRYHGDGSSFDCQVMLEYDNYHYDPTTPVRDYITGFKQIMRRLTGRDLIFSEIQYARVFVDRLALAFPRWAEQQIRSLAGEKAMLEQLMIDVVAEERYYGRSS